MDARYQNFWVENIEKEAALRFAWQLRYSKGFSKKNAAQGMKTTDQDNQPAAAAGKSFKQNISEHIDKIESQLPSRKMASQLQTPIGSTFSSRPSTRRSRQKKLMPVSDMRPPSVRTKALLYEGISAHGEGRLSYLNKRKFLSPEDKYEFPVLSSCQYGWKITDMIKEPEKSKFARTCIIRDTFYKNSGIELWDVYAHSSWRGISY